MRSRTLYIIFISCLAFACSRTDSDVSDKNGAYPEITPDYRSVTIPPDIAPLNFKISGEFDRTRMTVSGKNFRFEKEYDGNKVTFPLKKWKRLLKECRGDSIQIEISSVAGDVWTRYRPFLIYVSGKPVDDYLVYRLLMPGFQNWNQMGIYQRSLADFNVKTILDSRVMPGTCMNCHSFAQNSPDNMVFHLRESYGGTILYQNKKLSKINTRTDKMFANAAFPSWHPSKRFIAFSVNRVNQIFHAVGPARAAAIDLKSDIFVYDIERNEMLSSPILSSEENFETFPCFSADGTVIYYCSAERVMLPAKYDSIRYSLCSVTFDAITRRFGEKPDTLVSAATSGKSISMPKVSPDGRFILFSIADYGAFPSYNPEADLALFDLKDGTFRKLDAINSGNVESWHSWSSNGRWIAFSSRRMNGLYSNVYLAYMDENGNPGKPFLLPQKDPDFYGKFLFSFNVPEFITKGIDVNPYQIEKAAKSAMFTQVQSGSSH